MSDEQEARPRQARGKAEPVAEAVPEPVHVNVETFCAVNAFPRSIASRLGIYLAERGESADGHTMKDWQAIYQAAMSRVTN